MSANRYGGALVVEVFFRHDTVVEVQSWSQRSKSCGELTSY